MQLRFMVFLVRCQKMAASRGASRPSEAAIGFLFMERISRMLRWRWLGHATRIRFILVFEKHLPQGKCHAYDILGHGFAQTVVLGAQISRQIDI
jgi:hypothetical protein